MNDSPEMGNSPVIQLHLMGLFAGHGVGGGGGRGGRKEFCV